jgi:hypothetical protein
VIGVAIADEDRVAGLRIGVEQLLDEDLVLPVIAEVIGVEELIADAAEKLADAHRSLVGELELGIWRPEPLGAPLEDVHVVARPAEGGDDRLVQAIEAHVRADLKLPPYRRF